MRKLNVETGVMEEYSGYEPSPEHKIIRVSGAMTPTQFWDNFISKRRPCIVTDTSGLGKDFKAKDWTSISHLRDLAGSSKVKIEPIGQAGSFGTSAPRKLTTFSNYLDLLKDKDESEKWYLTTQYEEAEEEESENEEEEISSTNESEIENFEEQISDEEEEEALKALLEKETLKSKTKSKSKVQNDSQEQGVGILGEEEDVDEDQEEEGEEIPTLDTLFPSPTENLISEFPPQPELLGGLVLQQCNLWLGGCKDGKSSGLHHDFHDNLYVLLSGHKRFLLFPPTAYKYLHPRGDIERVTLNGLISYTPPDQLPYFYPQSLNSGIRADGLPPLEAALWRLSARKRTLMKAEDNAARLSGEEHRGKKERKGKGKMTNEMEEALKGVKMAENELRLIRLQEDGEIDWNLDSDEDEEEEDEEEDNEEEEEEDEIDYEAEESDDDDQKLKVRKSNRKVTLSDDVDDDDESSYYSSEADSIDEAMNLKIDNFTPELQSLMIKFWTLEREDIIDVEAIEKIKETLKPHLDQATKEIELERSKLGKSMQSSKSRRNEISKDKVALDVLKSMKQSSKSKRNEISKDRVDLDVLKSMIEVEGGKVDIDALRAIIEAENQIEEESEDEEDENEDEEDRDEQVNEDDEEEEEEEDEGEDEEEGWRFFDEIEKDRMRKEDREAGLEEGDFDTGDSLGLSDEEEEEEDLEIQKKPMVNGKRKRKSGINGSDQPSEKQANNKKSKLQKQSISEEENESDSSISNLSQQSMNDSSVETSDSEPLFPPRDEDDEDQEDDSEEEEDWENLGKDLADGENLLAQLGMQQDALDEEKEKLESEKKSNQKNSEPPSFSKIKPKILHAFFGISNDSSQSNGSALTKSEKRKLKKQRKQAARNERRGKNGSHPKNKSQKKKVEKDEDEEEEEELLIPLEGCPKPLVVDLRPGEMLYLPASWYHEVTSSAAPSTSNSSSSNSNPSSNVHMALNYWMHPPDALEYYEIQVSSKELEAHKEKVKKSATSSSAKLPLPSIPNLPPGAPIRFAHQTGHIDSPYRDSEVWNEIRRKVLEEIEICRKKDEIRRTVESKLKMKINENLNENGMIKDEDLINGEPESLEDTILERLKGIKSNGMNGQGKKRERDKIVQDDEDDEEEEKALEELLQKEIGKNRKQVGNGEKRNKKKKKT